MSETPLTAGIVRGSPARSLSDYTAAGGYEGLRAALKMSPPEVQQVVKDSNLRGRGGAGFPTGVKWGFVPLEEPGIDPGRGSLKPKYVVANCDEMEPGTFKDRLLIWGDPHQVIEGMIIAAHAIDANAGYIFVRWAYQEGANRLQRAIVEAKAKGLLGDNILGSGFSFQLHVHTSAGRYICGEETALLNSLEGRRPNPRFRPPFPALQGLWDRPTLIQNIETLACVPHILANGAEWFNDLGAGRDAGTKLYGVSGKVRRPGTYELPIGVTTRELIEEHCGGMQDGLEAKATIPGGASTMYMRPDEFDLPLDFTSLAEADNRLGTAGVMVFDNRTCLVGATLNLEHFFAQESCGWCTPCRDGLPWVEDLLRDIEEGRGKAGDVELLSKEMALIAPNSFCALALGAEGPVRSVIEKFRHELDEHVHRGGCPFEPPALPAIGGAA